MESYRSYQSLARTELTLSNSQRRYNEFQCNNQNQSISYKNRQNNCPQFDQPNSFSIEPSLLKSVNTINVPITTGKGNAALEVPPANGKENTTCKWKRFTYG